MSDRTDRGNRPEREEGADRARRGEGDRRRQGRAAEAKDWFAHVARIDDNEWTDAADRLREL